LYAALGGLFVLLPYVLIELGGYSGTAAGAALLPFPVVLAAASPRMGALVGKIGSRWPLTLGPIIVGFGFFLLVRVCAVSASYVTTVLPALLLIAIGMTGAVAPLTAAVLSSVDSRHTGSASGLNSALARTGGLVATALLGTVLATRGAALASGFHMAAIVGSIMCVASGASAFVTLKR
ncbi:MAG: MFS transporter, partial [Polyangiaceae bacterium]